LISGKWRGYPEVEAPRTSFDAHLKHDSDAKRLASGVLDLAQCQFDAPRIAQRNWHAGRGLRR
jgi:hypothetical protein